MPTRRILLTAAAASIAMAGAARGQTRLDAHFADNRVVVDAPLAAGGKLRFWTDTGGGGTILYDTVVAKLGLATAAMSGEMAEDLPPGTQQLAAPLPLADSAMPTPPGPVIVAPNPLARMGVEPDSDGNLGQGWFSGHVWTWDYPGHTLTVEPTGWTPPAGAQVVPVGFRPASDKGPALHFPRIVVSIAGEEVPVLLDSGATTVLTPEAFAVVGGGARLQATSMIVASRVAAWHAAHPEWRTIEHGQAGTGSRMIEIPDVRIAGIQVGPVWFTERPDPNFRQMMSQAMDAPVEGAIGGNALKALRMSVDYVHGRAAFSRPGLR